LSDNLFRKLCKVINSTIISAVQFTEPRLNTNLVHSKAVRKPLVAIILNILRTTFYSRTIEI